MKIKLLNAAAGKLLAPLDWCSGSLWENVVLDILIVCMDEFGTLFSRILLVPSIRHMSLFIVHYIQKWWSLRLVVV